MLEVVSDEIHDKSVIIGDPGLLAGRILCYAAQLCCVTLYRCESTNCGEADNNTTAAAAAAGMPS